jgi:hypothetical protein
MASLCLLSPCSYPDFISVYKCLKSGDDNVTDMGLMTDSTNSFSPNFTGFIGLYVLKDTLQLKDIVFSSTATVKLGE